MKTNLVFKTLPRTNCSSVRQWEAILGNLATAPLRHYLLATGQLKVMAMQLLLPSLGQFPRWFVKWLELVTRTSQVESWVKGGYLGRLAYQDNCTFQSFIRPFVNFSRNLSLFFSEHWEQGWLCWLCFRAFPRRVPCPLDTGWREWGRGSGPHHGLRNHLQASRDGRVRWKNHKGIAIKSSLITIRLY